METLKKKKNIDTNVFFQILLHDPFFLSLQRHFATLFLYLPFHRTVVNSSYFCGVVTCPGFYQVSSGLQNVAGSRTLTQLNSLYSSKNPSSGGYTCF